VLTVNDDDEEPDVGWLIVSVAVAAGVPRAVVNVTTPLLSAPVLFAGTDTVTGLLPIERVAPTVTNPNPEDGVYVTHDGADEICHCVFDNVVTDAEAAVVGADHVRLL